MKNKSRKPVVAGLFYPAGKAELSEMINSLELKESDNIDKSYSKKDIIGAIVPHAGYVYSGYHAVHFFSLLKERKDKLDTVVIINPNHRGVEDSMDIDSHLQWETPLGLLNIDHDFYHNLELPYNYESQLNEHSAEVMLPFLQYFISNDILIAPVSMSDQSHKNALSLAKKIANAVKATNKNIIIIASSDYSHYVSPEEGYKFDDLVCEKINALDAKGVYEVIKKNNISVCGYGPIMTLIEYSKLMHTDTKTKILRRGHSGEFSHSDEVVHYITTLFYK